MKASINNPFGYKICYTERRLKRRYVTKFMVHSYKRAKHLKKEYVLSEPRKKRKTWHILPVTKKDLRRGIWERPF